MENSQQASSPSESTGTDAASGGGAPVDYSSILESHQNELAAARAAHEQTNEELGSVRAQAKEASSKLDALRQALVGEQDTKPDPIDTRIHSLQGQIDELLEAAIQHERAGKPIPLTVNNGISNLRFQIEALEEKRASQKEIAALHAQVKQLSNPGNAIDQTAYSNMDTQVISAINTIYGTGQESEQVRGAQFRAVSDLITKEILDLKKNDPDTWDRIRRDRTAQQKLVTHFVKQSIPPKARQIMEDEEIRTTEMPTGELMAAFREARDLAKANPTAKNTALMGEIRRQVLERVYSRDAQRGSAKARINDLF